MWNERKKVSVPHGLFIFMNRNSATTAKIPSCAMSAVSLSGFSGLWAWFGRWTGLVGMRGVNVGRATGGALCGGNTGFGAGLSWYDSFSENQPSSLWDKSIFLSLR